MRRWLTLAAFGRPVVFENLTFANGYTAVAGYVTLGVRGGLRIGARQELLFDVENMTDRNYRGVAWGMDAPGVGLSVVYTMRF